MAKCNRGFEIQVLSSSAGFYLGTLTNDGEPMCRLSIQYYKTRAIAEEALRTDRFDRRDSIENLYCRNPYGSCFSEIAISVPTSMTNKNVGSISDRRVK